MTDGVNLVLKNATNTGLVKVQVEEVLSPDEISATIDDQPVPVAIFRIDPRPPRHNLDIQMPPRPGERAAHAEDSRLAPHRSLIAPVALC